MSERRNKSINQVEESQEGLNNVGQSFKMVNTLQKST